MDSETASIPGGLTVFRNFLINCVFLALLPGALSAAEWELSYHDDFEREELGEDWVVGQNGYIEDGKLWYGKNDDGIALLNRSFASDVRVEMIAEAWPGRPPCDLAVVLAARLEPDLRWGYLAAFGGQSNTLHHITGGSEMSYVFTRYPDQLIEHGKVYRITGTKEGQRISLSVNGEEVLSTTDADVLGGPGFDQVGLLTWNGMLVDEMWVYERSEPHPDTPEFVEPLEPLVIGVNDAGKLVCREPERNTEAVREACALYNQGHYREAEQKFLDVNDVEVRAAGVAYCIGHVNYIEELEDNQRAGELFNELAAAYPDNATFQAYGVYGDVLQRMSLYKASGMPSGGMAVPRIVAIGSDNNPFYDKAKFYAARYLRATGMESANRGKVRQAMERMRELHEKYPENPSLKEMFGEKVPWGEELSITDESIPLWARAACETYARQCAILEEWFTTRQQPDGQLGGGWGDDVEILRSWGPFAFISDGNPEVRNGIERLCEGMWQAELTEYGFSEGFGDSEHSAEPSADTIPIMMALRYGDPYWIERNMKTCRTIRDIYTGIDDNGYVRFKSSYFGGGEVGQSIRYGGDCWWNGRTIRHMMWAAWYGNRNAHEHFISYADGWLMATYLEWAGKESMQMPDTIWYPSGEIYPEGTFDWKADVGQFSGGNPGFITSAWRSAHILSGHDRYLPALRRHEPYRYEYRTDLEKMRNRMDRLSQGLRYNLVTKVREVLQTDRAVLAGADSSYSYFTGATDNWRNNNMVTSAVNYDVPNTDFAGIVVASSDERHLQWLYNLGGDDMEMGLQLWQLRPGTYEVRLGTVSWPEGGEPEYTWTETDAFEYARRGARYALTLPSREAVAVEFRLKEARDVPEWAPDVAIGGHDLVRDGGRLAVTVHNLGTEPAEDVEVALQRREDGGYETIRTEVIDVIDSPDDLSPRTETVTFRGLRVGRDYRIALDPDEAMTELYEGNNMVAVE